MGASERGDRLFTLRQGEKIRQKETKEKKGETLLLNEGRCRDGGRVPNCMIPKADRWEGEE